MTAATMQPHSLACRALPPDYCAQIGGVFVAVRVLPDNAHYSATLTTLEYRASLTVGRPPSDRRVVDSLETLRDACQAAIVLCAYDPEEQSDESEAIRDATEAHATETGLYSVAVEWCIGDAGELVQVQP